MITTLMIFQVVITIILIALVLLQFGKGAEAGLLSGGGGESIMTGAQQGNILSKATVVVSILFMANCILLSKLQADKAGTTIFDDEAPVARPLNSDAPMDKTIPEADAESKEAPATTTEEQKK